VPRRVRRERARHAGAFPCARFTADLDEALVDVVALATPVPLHAEMTIRVLPSREAFLRREADGDHRLGCGGGRGRRRGQRPAPSWSAIFSSSTPGDGHRQAVIDDGELGRTLYVHGKRLNFGKLRADENVLWSRTAHDVTGVAPGR
jgi:hypothetical protein